MSRCDCRRCAGPLPGRAFTITPTPVTVTIERVDADEMLDEPDRLDIAAYRGTLLLGSTEIHRGERLDTEMAAEWHLSDNERDQLSAIFITEWLAWPSEQEPKGEPAPQLSPELLAQFDALKGALSR